MYIYIYMCICIFFGSFLLVNKFVVLVVIRVPVKSNYNTIIKVKVYAKNCWKNLDEVWHTGYFLNISYNKLHPVSPL